MTVREVAEQRLLSAHYLYISKPATIQLLPMSCTYCPLRADTPSFLGLTRA
jgi:hypothetical protein